MKLWAELRSSGPLHIAIDLKREAAGAFYEPIWLEEPWSRRFGTLPIGQKLLKNDSEHMYEAQAALDKFFDAGHYMKKHDPSLPVEGRFYG